MKRIATLAMIMLCCALGPETGWAGNDENPLCEGTIGVANGLCTAATQIGCGTDEERNAQACARIEEHYLRITGQMPPWLVTCPCWTNEILEAGELIEQCLDSHAGDPGLAAVDWGNEGFACTGTICLGNGELSCGILNNALPGPVTVTSITPEEHSVCRAQILAVCEGFLD